MVNQKDRGRVIRGILLFLCASFAAFVGLLFFGLALSAALAEASSNGVGTIIVSIVFFSPVIFFVGILGITGLHLVLQGLGMNIGGVKREKNESRWKHFRRIIGYILFFLLLFVSVWFFSEII